MDGLAGADRSLQFVLRCRGGQDGCRQEQEKSADGLHRDVAMLEVGGEQCVVL